MNKKLTYLCRVLLLCLFSLWVSSAQSQNNQLISLKLNQASFKDLLKAIEGKTDYRFVYDGLDVTTANKVTLDVKDTNVRSILDKELPKSNIRYEITGNQIVLTKIPVTTQKEIQVRGVVTDELNETVPGVSIAVKGTTIGTLSDGDGAYKLNIPAGTSNPILVFSSIGFAPKEEVVGGRSVIDVQMKEVSSVLDEVVIVGYGTVKKGDATGALDVIKSSDFNKGTVSSPEMLLNGHVAGVQVTPGNGQPGANATVRIRGINSISASSEPLYVIDGVPIENTRNAVSLTGDQGLSNMTLNPLSMIAAADIESMTVLKDASATAIYGSRGANGVIIITTKGGKDGISSVSYSGSAGISNVTKKLELLTADQYRQYDPQNDGGANTDWQKEIFRTALVQDHNLTFSNGTKNTSYRVSLSVSQQQGIIISTGLTRYTLNSNVNHKMFDGRLILTMNANNTNYGFDNILEPQTSGSDGGIINNALKANPTEPVYKNGTFNEYSDQIRNPVAMAKQISDKNEGNRFIGSGDATLFLIPKDLSVKTSLAYDVDNATRKAYQPSTSRVARADGGFALVENSKYSNLLTETYITYNKSINDKHMFNVVGGYSWQKFDNYVITETGKGFSSDIMGADNLKGAKNTEVIRLDHEINKLISFYARINYNFTDKYLFTATLRRDGSSRFGPNNRWALFPSAAFAWKVKEESFMKNISAINDLKFRLGYGVTGNQDIGNFRYSKSIGISNEGTYFDGIYYPSYQILGIPNSNLKWESTAQLNAGIDFALLKGKISGSLDVYSKKTSDLLLTIDAIQPAVASTYLGNIGAMTNKGVELTLNSPILDRKNLSWDLNFNIAYNQNKITELFNNKDINYGTISGKGTPPNIQIIRVGESFGTFYGRKFLRIENGKEVFESENYELLGSALPKVTLGFSNSIRYNKWDMSVVFRSALGGKIYNNTRAEVSQGDRLPGQNTNMEGAELYKESYDLIGKGVGIEYRSSRWVEDGSFLRLDNLTIGYNLSVFPKVVKNARIYGTAQNLFVITKYKGYDPEVNNHSTSKGINSTGIDYCAYPHARTFIVGLSVNF